MARGQERGRPLRCVPDAGRPRAQSPGVPRAPRDAQAPPRPPGRAAPSAAPGPPSRRRPGRPVPVPFKVRPGRPAPLPAKVTGAHLAGGHRPGCARPRYSPSLLLSTACCVGPAGSAGRQGAAGAGRSPRAPGPAPPGTCAALRGELAGAPCQRVHRAGPGPRPRRPLECRRCPSPGP